MWEMVKKIGGGLKKIGKFFTSKVNTFQKAGIIIGGIFGLGLAFGLFFGGIAAIPFIGPAAIAPAWAVGLGIAFFFFSTFAGFTSSGKYIGVAIDALVDKEKPNNEKLGTLVGCILGALLAILFIPLDMLGVGSFIAKGISLPLWQLALIMIPAMTGTFGSNSSNVGKFVDVLTTNKTVLDVLPKEKAVELIQPTDFELDANAEKTRQLIFKRSFPTGYNKAPALIKKDSLDYDLNKKNHQGELKRRNSFNNFDNQATDMRGWVNVRRDNVEKNMDQFERGVTNYLRMSRGNKSRDDKSHLHWTSIYFDNNRGVIRANTYLQLFRLEDLSVFSKKVIIYSLLASTDGSTLQEQVWRAMRYPSLESARTSLINSINSDMGNNIENKEGMKKNLNELVIAKIVKNANNKNSFDSGKYDEALTNLKAIDQERKIKVRSTGRRNQW